MDVGLLPRTAVTVDEPSRDLSGRELLDRAAGSVTARRGAEVAELEVALAWADRNGVPADDRDPMTSPGGDGTPQVREYALPELAMARGEHTLRTRSLVADALDLAHRLPLTWARLLAGEAEPWVARKVAVLSRRVALGDVAVVDRAVARAIDGHAASTVLEIAASKVAESDLERHLAERERSRHERYVSPGRCDEFGFRPLVARMAPGDVALLDAMVEQVAQALVPSLGHDHNHDELRAIALGWLARPVEVLRLLLEQAAQWAADGTLTERPPWLPEHTDDTLERLAAMTPAQLAAVFGGKATMFVHVTDQSLLTGEGIARVEALGPLAVSALRDLLGHMQVVVKPVIDQHSRPRSDAYEHPERVKDQVWTLAGGDTFPYSPRTASRSGVDFDHTVPFVPLGDGGPPGQTGPHNSGPLRRSHHRWKTHGGYTVRPCGPGRYAWSTPHGLALLVDPDGTRRLSDGEAELILGAPAGVDVYTDHQVVLIGE